MKTKELSGHVWTYVDVCESPRARELNRTGIKKINNYYNYQYQKNKGERERENKGKGRWDDVKPLPVTVTIRGGVG